MQTDVLQKFKVNILGKGNPTIVFAHGFGSDQMVWRHQMAAFQAQYCVVAFDYLGCDKADIRDYNPLQYNSLYRYIADLLAIYGALTDTIFVGHSVSAMLRVLASHAKPQWFRQLIFIGVSPRYLNDGAYIGGFEQRELDILYDTMAANYLRWATGFGSMVMANVDRPELGQEFARSRSAMRPDLAQSTARLIFESDLRAELPHIQHPVLLLQSNNDIAGPIAAGVYLAAHIPQSQLVLLNVEGHLPHLSAPNEVTHALNAFITAERG